MKQIYCCCGSCFVACKYFSDIFLDKFVIIVQNLSCVLSYDIKSEILIYILNVMVAGRKTTVGMKLNV